MPHIKTIHLKNFTCFKDLKVENIGKINFVFGANGCGKTWFLRAIDLLCNYQESLSKNETSKSTFASSILNIINDTYFFASFFKKNAEIKEVVSKLSYFFNDKDYSIESDFQKITRKDIGERLSKFEDREIRRYPGRFTIRRLDEMDIQEYIEFNTKALYVHNESYWKDFIFNLIDKIGNDRAFKDKILNNIIKKFFPDCTDIASTRESINMFLEGHEEPMSISLCGYGFKRMITYYYLSTLNKDGTIVIDEVDNGLHFDKYKLSFETLTKSSKENNTQMFLSSHSPSYCKAFFEYIIENKLENDVNIIGLLKNKFGEITLRNMKTPQEALDNIENYSENNPFKIV